MLCSINSSSVFIISRLYNPYKTLYMNTMYLVHIESFLSYRKANYFSLSFFPPTAMIFAKSRECAPSQNY